MCVNFTSMIQGGAAQTQQQYGSIYGSSMVVGIMCTMPLTGMKFTDDK